MFDPLTPRIIGALIDVHRALGPGLLESAYEACLCAELAARGLRFARQAPVRIAYKDVVVDCAYRVDFIVEDAVLVELKAVEELQPIHTAQVITYLRLTGIPIGLLVNFNVPYLREGLRRLTRDLPPPRDDP